MLNSVTICSTVLLQKMETFFFLVKLFMILENQFFRIKKIQLLLYNKFKSLKTNTHFFRMNLKFIKIVEDSFFLCISIPVSL